MLSSSVRGVWCACLFLLILISLAAGSAEAVQSDARAADGPPPPVAPAVLTRDASGHATIRAVRLTTPLRIDGRLDEEIYSTVPSISGFIQQEPVDGAPATEETEVWVFFDDDNIYVVGRCWDSHPERMVANEMRRDGARVREAE